MILTPFGLGARLRAAVRYDIAAIMIENDTSRSQYKLNRST